MDTQGATRSGFAVDEAETGALAGGCCGATGTKQRQVQVQAAAMASPCCGTSEQADAEGSCCGTSAKAEAVAAGAGCCG